MPFLNDDESHANADGIATAVGGLLAGLNTDDAISDDQLDAELDAKAGATATEDVETVDDAVPDKPDAVTEPVAEEEDPLKDAPVLKYVVDGAEKSADWIKVYTDKEGIVRGAIVAPDQIPALQQRLSRADYYETQNKALYEKTQQYERAGGIERVQSLTGENAKLADVIKVFSEYFDPDNPQKLLALAYAVQEGDKYEFEKLLERVAFTAERASFNATKQWGQQSTQHTTQQQEQAQRAETTTRSIAASVEQWSTQYPELTAEDKQKAIAHLTRIGSAVVRPASPEEARSAGVAVGSLIIDHPVVADYLAERAELRKAASASANAQSTVNAENAKRLAGAARGAIPKKTTRITARQVDPVVEGETWQEQKARLQGGSFATSDH